MCKRLSGFRRGKEGNNLAVSGRSRLDFLFIIALYDACLCHSSELLT